MRPLVMVSSLILLLVVVLLSGGGALLPSEMASRLQVGSFLFLTIYLRYLVIAGLAFIIFYGWKKENWLHRRIQQRFPDAAILQQEYRYSLSTFAIFTLIGLGVHEAKKAGYTLIYTDIAEYGWWWFGASIIIALIIHDTYFYWTHRLMHWKPLFRVMHAVHHRSHNPSPWASFSFHPTEAVVEAGIVPLLAFILPMHPLAIAGFLLVMTIMNVLGHLGYELYPSGFTRHRLLGLNNTSTHHNMHHKYTRCNYGLYFNWWDRVMGTNHARYQEHFEEVASRQRALDGRADYVNATRSA
jgi:Delta7-sterol 5-desaturase